MGALLEEVKRMQMAIYLEEVWKEHPTSHEERQKLVEEIVRTTTRVDLKDLEKKVLALYNTSTPRGAWEDYERIATSCLEKGISLLLREDTDWPFLLETLSDQPLWLWVSGRENLKGILNYAPVAVVGSRQPGAYSRKITKDLVTALTHNGHAITSGLAIGIDGLAHQTCLQVGAPSLALLPCGILQCYPPQHQELLQSILRTGGCALSEFLPKETVRKSNFHRRNRLISALSVATVVVQGGERSGTLITARQAAEQGREVWVVPSHLYDESYKGSLKLISDGANILDSLERLSEIPQPLVRCSWSSLEKTSQTSKAKTTREISPNEIMSEIISLLEAAGASREAKPSPADRKLLSLIESHSLDGLEYECAQLVDRERLLIWTTQMEQMGLITRRRGRFTLTERGLSCIYNF